MSRHVLRPAALALCIASLAAAPVVLAGDEPGPGKIVVVGDDGTEATIALDGTRLTVTTRSDDGDAVREVDLAAVAEIAGQALEGALSGVQAALDAVGEQGLRVEVDGEHRVTVDHGDRTTTIDVAAIMAEVASALDDVVIEWDDEDLESLDEAAIRAEIEAARAEIARLRAELDAR